MTKKEIDKLKNWKFGKSPIGGYLFVFPKGMEFMKEVSEYQKESSEKFGYFCVFPDHNGFTIGENGIKFKTQKFTNQNQIKGEIPYKYIQKVRLYNYNY